MKYIDIETVSAYPSYEEADARTQDLFFQKMRFEPSVQAVQLIDGQRDYREVMAKLYEEKAAVLAEFNKVVCVSFGEIWRHLVGEDTQNQVWEELIELKSIAGADELALLVEVGDILQNEGELCAHFGKGFDYPVLSRKFIMHGLGLPHCLNNAGKKPWEIGLVDTAELWKFGDMRHSASLDLLAHCFGLPSPKEGMHGADVSRVFWGEGEEGLKKIATYCEGDVRTLINVHRKMIGQSVIV